MGVSDDLPIVHGRSGKRITDALSDSHSWRLCVGSMLNPSKLREDTLGLTVEHEIQRCRLQDLVIFKEPQRALIAINLACPSNDRGNLRPRSFEGPELLDLDLEP